ncbi:MAG: 50S ribosomal protein L18 [Candidatus Diapherotrites archaeon]
MSHTSTYEPAFRRRREEKTDYTKRLAQLKSGKHRLVVRKSNNSTIVQIVRFEEKGDVMVSAANSRELKEFGWKMHCGNLPAAYLAAFLCCKKAGKKGPAEAILDIGLSTPVHGSRVFAALKGAVDSGMKIKCDEKVFPSADRFSGKHISEDAAKQFIAVKDAIEKKYGGK